MSCARATAILATGLLAAAPGCSLQFLPMAGGASDTPVNSCKLDVDCGSNATCYQGSCFAKSGVIDEVLLEVVPDANSLAGGLSYLQMQSGLASGVRDRVVSLPARTEFVTQVLANPEMTTTCNDVSPGKHSIPARIEFVRTGAIGGVQILSLTTTPLTIETTLSSGAWNAKASLVPGTYDIYVTPIADTTCARAPRILRGIVVGDVLDPAVAPATIDLPTPSKLGCQVWREPPSSGSLEGWTVDIIEPQDGRVISTTSNPLGQTNVYPYWTNFEITYQKLTPPQTPTSKSATVPASGPIVRISPPAAMTGQAPIVYWDLSAVDLTGDGSCSLDMRGLPILPDQLVDVSGQVRGKDPRAPDQALIGVRATLQFASQRLDGAEALTAVFQKSITTDDNGNYTTRLFPGQYRVAVIPSTSTQNGVTPPLTLEGTQATGGATRPWAFAEEQWTIPPSTIPPTTITLDEVLPSKRSVTGQAHAGLDPASGATLQASPVLAASDIGPLNGALGKVPVLPQNAGVSLSTDGRFRLPLDPGAFDLTISAPHTSNFAWWVKPGALVTLPDATSDTTPIDNPDLSFPVPFEGTLTAPDATGQLSTVAPLRSAAVRAYAKVPTGSGVTKVGEARTDDAGRFRLRLPPNFAP
jgi:hypothetical protein